MVICLERGADLHMSQLMPLPLTVSCFSKIQIGFTFVVLAHLGSPGKGAIKRVCVCVCLILYFFYLCMSDLFMNVLRHFQASKYDYAVRQQIFLMYVISV